jgi:hypothetical protein
VRAVFEAPTIAGLAARMVTHQSEQMDEATLRQVLAEIEQLSDEQTQTRLTDSAD